MNVLNYFHYQYAVVFILYKVIDIKQLVIFIRLNIF